MALYEVEATAVARVKIRIEADSPRDAILKFEASEVADHEVDLCDWDVDAVRKVEFVTEHGGTAGDLGEEADAALDGHYLDLGEEALGRVRTESRTAQAAK